MNIGQWREIAESELNTANPVVEIPAKQLLSLLDVAEGLAKLPPPIYDGMYCMLCHKRTEDESRDWGLKPENHTASCPWVLARRMVPNVIGDENG